LITDPKYVIDFSDNEDYLPSYYPLWCDNLSMLPGVMAIISTFHIYIINVRKEIDRLFQISSDDF
jgi:hypothetical protein